MVNGPIVVLAMTHDAPQLLNLLASGVLSGRDTALVVHHDPLGVAPRLGGNDRVIFIPEAKHLRWGREDLGLAILDGLEFCLKCVPDLAWVLVVSGRDQLCRPMHEIETELSETANDAFLRWFPVPFLPGASEEHHWQVQCRRRYLKRVRLPGSHHSIPFPRRSPFSDRRQLFVGDAWVNLNRRALRHVLEQRRRHRDVEQFLSRCTATDEALLPTLLLNDHADLSVGNSTRRYMRWVPGAAHPAVLSEADIGPMVRSDAFFARKFNDIEIARAVEGTYRSAEGTP